MPRFLRIMITALIACAPDASMAQTRYQFTVLGNDPNWCQVSPPSLNNTGQVAFRIVTCGFSPDIQVIRANVGEQTTLFGIQGQTTYGTIFSDTPSINDAGTAAFVLQKPDLYLGLYETVVVTAEPGVLTVVAEPSDPNFTVDGKRLRTAVSVSIHNSANAVAIQSSFEDGSGDVVIRESGGTFSMIAGPGTVVPGLGTLFGATSPIMNGAGAVLFFAGGTQDTGLARSDGSSFTLVAKGQTYSSQSFSVPFGFNDNAVASFAVARQIFKGSSELTTAQVASLSAFGDYGAVTAINNAGAVVFSTFIGATNPLPGVFTGADPVADRVLGPGDVVPGLGTVRYAQAGNEAINNNGQIAMMVDYDPGDGTHRLAIIRADPPCAVDVTASTTVSLGQIKLNRKSGRYTQTVTLKNSDGAVTGPVSLTLDNLTNATLFNAGGTTWCTTPSGSPYVNVDLGADATFTSRERATVTLEFTNPAGQAITYTPRILAGPNDR